MKVTIKNYTISEEVHITYEGNYMSYTFYSLECKELTKELLHVMKKGYDVEVIEEEYTPEALKNSVELEKLRAENR
jgi:hypothetical protein